MKLEFSALLRETAYGLLARLLHPFVPVRRGHWVFGSDYGNQYREGSKYLIEYMVSEHPDYHCTFITRNPKVKAELDARGIPCEMNFSWRGVWAITRAEAVFCTQFCDDIFFAYHKAHRRYYFLVHGMPYKRAFKAVPDAFKQKYERRVSGLRRLGAAFRQWLVLAFTMDDFSMVACCSEFNQRWMPDFFGPSVAYPILGMPRNDAFFQPERMAGEKWISQARGKFVVTYMPTHRAYGRGKATPTPFASRPDIQQWMVDNDVLFVMKNHPNMISVMGDVRDTPAICDITRLGIDPQIACYHSDVLVTDYSSVWMDYLLLQRPVLFYYYDDYEAEDEGLLFSIKGSSLGHHCSTEDQLFDLIRRAKTDYDSMRPTPQQVAQYHQHVDGLSCRRHFEWIVRDLNQLHA